MMPKNTHTQVEGIKDSKFYTFVILFREYCTTNILKDVICYFGLLLLIETVVGYTGGACKWPRGSCRC